MKHKLQCSLPYIAVPGDLGSMKRKDISNEMQWVSGIIAWNVKYSWPNYHRTERRRASQISAAYSRWCKGFHARNSILIWSRHDKYEWFVPTGTSQISVLLREFLQRGFWHLLEDTPVPHCRRLSIVESSEAIEELKDWILHYGPPPFHTHAHTPSSSPQEETTGLSPLTTSTACP